MENRGNCYPSGTVVEMNKLAYKDTSEDKSRSESRSRLMGPIVRSLSLWIGVTVTARRKGLKY
ncbi:hypothetical protein DVH24_024576 [Malus domestica]|uniref:Uncharacterized protein n=1 Tax=Malus domestica TaxID=3750 RepID=A0A498JMS7_MALDO|nr:hypothetical protein DVH24_024576 [Malus domestica]